MVELKARQGILKLQSGDTLASLYLSVAESAKEDLDQTVEAVNALKKGWIAETDGVVREINIVAGETYHTTKGNASVSLDDIDISSLLSSVTSDTKDFSGIISQLFRALRAVWSLSIIRFLLHSASAARIYIKSSSISLSR